MVVGDDPMWNVGVNAQVNHHFCSVGAVYLLDYLIPHTSHTILVWSEEFDDFFVTEKFTNQMETIDLKE